MYQKMNQVFEQYGLEVNRSYKGRGALILECGNGLYNMKEYGGSERKLELLDSVLAYLCGCEDFVSETFIRTTEGGYVAKDVYDTSYYLRGWYQGRECNPQNRDEVLAAARTLAKLHLCLMGYGEEIPQEFMDKTEYLAKELARHNRELRKVFHYVREKRQKNEFEEAFLKNYKAVEKTAREVERRAVEIGEQKMMLCHGEYTHHNVVFGDRGVGILNFEQLCWDSAMSDLATFLRKIMEKNNWNIGLGMEVVGSYDREKKIEEQEWKELYIRLAYPMKFWKIANHYMNARKSWSCRRDYEKMQSFMEGQEARAQFLNFLAHSC